MSLLTVYADHDPKAIVAFHDHKEIETALAEIGIRFEQWPTTDVPLKTSEEIEKVYQPQIKKTMSDLKFESFDVVHITPDFPDKVAMRQKFLSEHQHSEDEARFFIDGGGLFYLHIKDKVYALKCEKSDFISVPSGIKHWFDTGAQPFFSVIRFFTNKEGWVAKYTDDPIAKGYPEYVP